MEIIGMYIVSVAIRNWGDLCSQGPGCEMGPDFDEKMECAYRDM